MRDYFGVEVYFVMNVTDVDDKIIIRGRQQHLFAEYLNKYMVVTREVLETAKKRIASISGRPCVLLIPIQNRNASLSKQSGFYGTVLRGGALDPDGKLGDAEAKIRMHVNTVTRAARVIAEVQHQFNVNSESTTVDGDITSEAFYDATRDIFLPYIDSLKASSVPGDTHEIFTKLTQKYEDHFTQDMRALNVLDPDEITRVTEYSAEIADFVAKIVDNRFGYVTPDESVYFDIQQSENAGHHYARLEPWNRNNQPLQRDGEGALSKTAAAVHKRSPDDFALWKASRPGEPTWPSPWGPGRPGWHIECSAMVSSRLGSQIDIHLGGIDLEFPHHDNELAQSEAYWSGDPDQQWVNYFLHMGHLSIQGSKMSKSLKNFTTVRDALDRGDWTPKGLRIVFLLGGWRDGIEISEDLVKASSSWEDKLTNFFINAKDVVRRSRLEESSLANSDNKSPLSKALQAAKDNVHEYFCDPFNTPKVMTAISDLVSVFNTQYIRSLDLTALRKILDQSSVSGLEASDSARPFLVVIENFRSSISLLQSEPRESDKALSKQILLLCDRLRDIELFNLGVYLEDCDDMPALVRPVTRDILQAREDLAQQIK
ncbi:tRNA synthetases class I (C) catalytic domain-containing protein [Aspergillus filifer]